MTARLAESWGDWVSGRPWAVFGTLKFTDGQQIGQPRALELARLFWQGVDVRHFGGQVRRKGTRIERAVFLQFGGSARSENLHFHFMANPPTPAKFCLLANEQWGALDPWCDGPRSWIQLANDSSQAARYAARETFFDAHRSTDSFRAEISHFEHEDGARLLRHIAEDRLSQRA